MTSYAHLTSVGLISVFVILTTVQWVVVGSHEVIPQDLSPHQFQLYSLFVAIIFSTIFFMSTIMCFTSKGAQLTCTISSCGIAAIAASSHYLTSLGLSPISINDGHTTVHFKFAEWMVSVPMLIFILGHVTQVAPRYVFFAMAISFLIVALGYVGELLTPFWAKLLLFSIAAFLYCFIMVCVYVLTVTLGHHRQLSQEHRRKHNIVLNQTMIQALGITMTVLWIVFPLAFVCSVTGVMSERAYLLSAPFFDVCSKGVFVAILNAAHSEGEARRMEAVVDELKADNQIQAKFLRFVYHEIRNPFNSIMLGLTHLEEEDLLSPYRQLLVMLRKSAIAMSKVIDDVVELTQLKGGLELVKMPIRVSNVLKSTLAMHSEYAEWKEILITEHVSKLLPEYLIGDSEKISKIFDCLISNALKFSPAKSTVDIALKVEKLSIGMCKVVFSVKDSGPGIPDTLAPRLFEPFAVCRPGDFSEDDNRGSGLGLCFAKQIADLMSATITFSTTEQLGTTFFFAFALDLCTDLEAAAWAGCEGRASLMGSSQELLQRKDVDMDAFGNRLSSSKVVPDTNAFSFGNSAKARSSPKDVTKKILEMNYEGKSGDIPDWYNLSRRRKLQPGESPKSCNPGVFGFTDMSKAEEAKTAQQSTLASTGNKMRMHSVPKEEHGSKNEEKCADSRALLATTGSREEKFSKVQMAPETQSVPNAEAAEVKEEAQDAEILIVDDVKSNQKLVHLILKKAGFQCDLADDGQQAVDRAKQHHYKIIFMDSVMPVMDGIEATRRILEFDDKVTIIALTGNVLQKDQNEFLQAGAKMVIGKPANKAQILKACDTFIQKFS